MSWFLCTISRHEPSNWGKCKEIGLWGVPGSVSAVREVKRGDRLLFWIGGKGYVGYGVVTEDGRVPQARQEAPWPGGLARWNYVIPIRVQVEIEQPLRLKFARSVQEQTGFSASRFQRGFSPIEDIPAQKIAEQILERSIEEIDPAD